LLSLAEQVFAPSVGQTAEPIRSGSGFHRSCWVGGEHRSRRSDARAHIPVKPSEIRTEAKQALINDIYKRIVEGEDFLPSRASQRSGRVLRW
jgi:hypothetical protein